MVSNSLQWTTLNLDNFDYTSLKPETRVVVEQCAGEIKALARNTAQNIIDIGLRIIEIKKHLKHGHYRRWLAAEFPWRKSTANIYERAAKKFSNVQSLDKFDLSAFYVLVCSTTPEIACEEALARANQGEHMTLAKVNSIVNQHKETQNRTPCETTVNVSSEELEPEIVLSADQDGLDVSSLTAAQSKPNGIDQNLAVSDEMSRELLPAHNHGVEDQNFQVGDRVKSIHLNRFGTLEKTQEGLGTAQWNDGYVSEGVNIDAIAKPSLEAESVVSQSIDLPRILHLEIDKSVPAEDTAQTFELMVWLQCEGSSHLLMNLFEQLQANPVFAEDMLRQAKAISSKSNSLNRNSKAENTHHSTIVT